MKAGLLHSRSNADRDRRFHAAGRIGWHTAYDLNARIYALEPTLTTRHHTKEKGPTLFDDLTREKSGTGRRPVRSRNYEPDSLTSCLACCVAFLDSDLASAWGSKVWMALPRLILVVFEHVAAFPPTVAPLAVKSHIKSHNPPGMFRLLLT